jgi:hypothetical protein
MTQKAEGMKTHFVGFLKQRKKLIYEQEVAEVIHLRVARVSY